MSPRFLKPLLVVPILLALPLSAASKVFKDTSDYRDSGEIKTYLNLKFDTYGQMHKEPKGTNCDWVMVASGFNLEELQKATVTYWVDSASSMGNNYLFTFWGNPLSTVFESALRTMGLQTQRAQGRANQGPLNPAEQFAAAVNKSANPQSIDSEIDKRINDDKLGLQMEMDRYSDDKAKYGLDEAIKRGEQRKQAKRAQLRKELEGNSAEASIRPENSPGYNLVLYVTESNHNAVYVPTNTTTAEFILLKDGKPVLAARHNSASMGWGGNSGSKCANALATAFRVSATN